MSWFGTADPIAAAWDLLRDAALVGWAATALFCAVTGTAVALWAGVRWWVGLLVGVLGLYAGLLLLLLVGGLRVGERARDARTARRSTAGAPPPGLPAAPPAAVPAAANAAATGTGWRATVGRGWRRWTRTPPTRTEVGVAVVGVLLAAGLVAATQVTWVTLSAVGQGVTGVGPFAIQLGLFVVVTAVAALVCAAGILRWRSAWWPTLLAWFAAWWLFVTVEVLRAEGTLASLNRLLRDQVRDRLGYDARPQLTLGVGWTVMAGLGVAMMVLAVVLLVLQGRRSSHYRLVARS